MRLIFIDTETSGLPTWGAPATELNAWPRLIQAAWIVTDEDGAVLKQVTRLVQPDGFEIPAEATRVHGISTARALVDGIPLEEVLEELTRDLLDTDLLVAHNIDFDLPVLQAEYYGAYNGEPLSRLQTFCTMKQCPDLPGLARSHAGGMKWPKLPELHRHLFQQEIIGAHDAMVDVAACMRCYFTLVERGLIAHA